MCVPLWVSPQCFSALRSASASAYVAAKISNPNMEFVTIIIYGQLCNAVKAGCPYTAGLRLQ